MEYIADPGEHNWRRNVLLRTSIVGADHETRRNCCPFPLVARTETRDPNWRRNALLRAPIDDRENGAGG